MDVEFKDINGNHVGLDLNSLVSSQVGDLEAVDIDLKSDNLVNAWIDYDGLGRVLKVSVSYSSQKPKVPILSVSLDLDPYVNDFMYVEFFGSTQGSTEIPSVDWWSFRSLFDSTTPVGDNDSPAPVSASVPPPPPGITLLNPTVDSIKCRRRHCLQPLLPVPINRRAASLYDEGIAPTTVEFGLDREAYFSFFILFFIFPFLFYFVFIVFICKEMMMWNMLYDL
ncbi:L-type lectin-domain containing receptor kinase VIII.1 [Linum perenne]